MELRPERDWDSLFVREGRAEYGSGPRSHRDLKIYQRAFGLAMKLFELSKDLPPEERYSITDQVRRSSRSVCANIAEAWRKRRYSAAFISKLNDAETEAGETQVWIEFMATCHYLPEDVAQGLIQDYEALIKSILGVIDNADKWVIPT